MKEFDDFLKLTEKSIDLDPWVKGRKLEGYCEDLLDEEKEVMEAIKKKNYENLKEELGDVFYLLVHAMKLAEERKLFKVEDVIKSASDKLNRRKPFVKENRKVTKDEAVKLWMNAKAEEKSQKEKVGIEYVYYVDEDDKVLGKVSRKDSMHHNLWHRGTGIFVFNSKGELLIPKRSKNKERRPSYWDVLFGGYVDYGESYEEAAKRELFEEAGIKTGLKFLFKLKYSDQESKNHGAIFKTISDGPFNFQKEEVEETIFITLEKLKVMLKKEKFSPDSIEAFNIYLKDHLK
jgi:isopentenyldiphosphate isomerase/NTP pyrophosphatase (non-canonical NTP hydrolase)